MRESLSSFVENNEKLAFVMMANGTFNRCLWPAYMQIPETFMICMPGIDILLLGIFHYLTLHYRYKT